MDELEIEVLRLVSEGAARVVEQVLLLLVHLQAEGRVEDEFELFKFDAGVIVVGVRMVLQRGFELGPPFLADLLVDVAVELLGLLSVHLHVHRAERAGAALFVHAQRVPAAGPGLNNLSMRQVLPEI